MEARDEPGRIRPLPPDLPEVAAPGGSAPPPRDRRWVPLAVAAGALVFFGVIAGVLSGPANEGSAVGRSASVTTTIGAIGAPERTTTTIPPAPPLLAEWAPPLQRDISIVYVEPSGVVTSEVLWSRDADAPGGPLSSGAAARVAAFDSPREQVMWITQGEQRQTLWVGRPPLAEPVFIDVTTAAWHTSAGGALAWIGRPPGSNSYHLFTAHSVPGGLEATTDLGQVDDGAELVAWGDWGYLIRLTPPPEYRRWEVDDPTNPGSSAFLVLDFAVCLDPAGMPVAAYAATPRAASALGHVVLQPATQAFELAVGAGLDVDALGLGVEPATVPQGPNGEPVVMLHPDRTMSDVAFEIKSPVTTFAFTPAATHVSAMGPVADRFAIETRTIDGSGLRITSVENVDTFVGFTREGTMLVLHSSTPGALVFHDWDRGASYRVPFDLGRVLAVDA
jgi:hypothetical protein